MEHCQWKGIFFPVVMTSEYLWYTFVLEILINYNPYNLFFLNDKSSYFHDLKWIILNKRKPKDWSFRYRHTICSNKIKMAAHFIFKILRYIILRNKQRTTKEPYQLSVFLFLS